MTTDQPDATTAPPRPTARPIRRRRTNRVLGGVASGIGDYFNIDPLIVRAVFVGLMIFGGAGLVLYVGAWLLVPAEGEQDSPLESVVRRIGINPTPTAVVLILLAALFLFVVLPSTGVPLGMFPTGETVLFVLFVAIVIIGVLLIRGGGTTGDVAAVEPSAAHPDAPADAVARPRTPRVPRGPLGMITLGGALLAVGGIALVDTASPEYSVTIAQLMGIGLGVVGFGLLIGSWWGNARLLIVPALLLLPIAWMASYIHVPLEGGWGSEWHYVDDVRMLQREYRLIAGDLTLDLRRLEGVDEPIEITATVAMGQINVLVPTEADLDVTARVGAGGTYIVDEFQRGTDLFDEVSRDGSGPRFVLDLATGLGSIQVDALEPDPVEGTYPGEICQLEGQTDCYTVDGFYIGPCDFVDQPDCNPVDGVYLGEPCQFEGQADCTPDDGLVEPTSDATPPDAASPDEAPLEELP